MEHVNPSFTAPTAPLKWSLDRRPHVLLGITGSVAAVKWEELTLELLTFADVRVIHTHSALHFAGMCREYAPHISVAWTAASAEVGSLGIAGSDNKLPVASARLGLLGDAVEWEGYARVGSDAVVHIDLRAWADVLIIAPASAHSIGKIVGGLADNLLTTVARAWPFMSKRVAKPFILAPAMNMDMWAHPVTESHMNVLKGWGVGIINPVEKVLACGDVGVGGLANIADIILRIKVELGVLCDNDVMRFESNLKSTSFPS